MMTAPLNELHSLIVYIIFGYALLLPLLLLSFRFFNISGPLQRSSLYLVAFLTPPVVFILYHTILVKRCQSELSPLWTDHGFHLLCVISESMLRIFLPLLGLLILFGLLKLGAAFLLIKRLGIEASTVEPVKDRLVRAIVEDRSSALKIRPPRLIISSRKGFAAFTAGILKPVLVVNRKMIELLDESELKALISHELIHIRHRDTLKNWFLHLVRDLTFFNPLSTMIFKGYLLEKEILCDQEAAELSGHSPHQYAAVLLKVWRSIIEHPAPRLGAISSFTGKNNIERRVQTLLKADQAGNKLRTPVTALLGIMLFTTTLLVLGQVC